MRKGWVVAVVWLIYLIGVITAAAYVYIHYPLD
jgi:hypothetical protein